MSATEITLLDGGMGTELRTRGVEVPSHITSIWSAKAIDDAPEAIVEVHRDYIQAGADVITINNYAVTHPLLSREGMEDRLEELTLAACDLAARARDEGRRPVRLAGSLPPLDTRYRADRVGEDPVILGEYRRIAEILAPRVDILLCETMASAREAVAACTAARETDREVWVSWTLQGHRPNHLPSGETVQEAHGALAPLDADAYLVNCCAANLVSDAIPRLADLTARRIGGYANSADVVVPTTADDPVEFKPLDVEAYGQSVLGWIESGATIVGGCCGTGPAHVQRLRRLIDR